MPTTKKYVLCALVCMWTWFFNPVSITAQGPPVIASHDSNSKDNRASELMLTRSQASSIARAQRDVDRLNRELASARQRLLALQLAAVPSAIRAASSPLGGATIVAMSGVTALTGRDNPIGFEVGDTVAFLRPDASHNVMVTGIGTDVEVFPDSVTLLITATGNGIEPLPEDRAYIISRADSFSSLSKYFNQQSRVSPAK